MQSLFGAQWIKRRIFLAFGALFGHFWVPDQSARIMIFSFSVSHIKKYPNLQFWDVGIKQRKKFWPKMLKNGNFCIFHFYHVLLNGHSSAIFWKYWLKFFFESCEDVTFTGCKKNWGSMTSLYGFQIRKYGKTIFWGRFLFFGAKFSYEEAHWSPPNFTWRLVH